MTEPAYTLTRGADQQEILDAFTRGHLAELHTLLPGRIETYDAATGIASVKPLLKRVYSIDGEDGEITERGEEYPVIPDCPVAFPRGGGAAITFPLKTGDPCWIMFAERSLDAWLDSDGKTVLDPDDARMHHLTDAVILPAACTLAAPIATAHADDVVIAREDGSAEVHITPGGEVQIKAGAVRLGTLSGAKALALAEKVDQRVGAIETWLGTHVHTDPLSGSTGPPPAPPTPGSSSASGKVFASG
jgi:hypothetical protein